MLNNRDAAFDYHMDILSADDVLAEIELASGTRYLVLSKPTYSMFINMETGSVVRGSLVTRKGHELFLLGNDAELGSAFEVYDHVAVTGVSILAN